MSDRPLSLRRFRAEVARVVASLPPVFRARLENVVIDILEEPSAGDLETALDAGDIEDDEESLLGLFIGVPLPEQEFGHPYPNRIKIFRRPHEEISESVADLRRHLRDTLLHELAHHFGYSEADLEAFEASRDVEPPATGGTE